MTVTEEETKTGMSATLLGLGFLIAAGGLVLLAFGFFTANPKAVAAGAGITSLGFALSLIGGAGHVLTR